MGKKIITMAKNGRILKTILYQIKQMVQPGITTKDIELYCCELLKKNDCVSAAYLYGSPPFPAHICTSVDEIVCHGIPNNDVLRYGQIISVDLCICKNGYYSDSCFSILVDYSNNYNIIQVCEKKIDLLRNEMWSDNFNMDVMNKIIYLLTKKSIYLDSIEQFMDYMIKYRIYIIQNLSNILNMLDKCDDNTRQIIYKIIVLMEYFIILLDHYRNSMKRIEYNFWNLINILSKLNIIDSSFYEAMKNDKSLLFINQLLTYLKNHIKQLKYPDYSERKKLIQITYDAVMSTIQKIKPGVSIRCLGRNMEQYAHKYGYSVVKEFAGHGISKKLHEAPIIPFYCDYEQPDYMLKSGDCITIEPMFVDCSNNQFTMQILKDGWSAYIPYMSAQFEHTILVTDNGYKILT